MSFKATVHGHCADLFGGTSSGLVRALRSWSPALLSAFAAMAVSERCWAAEGEDFADAPPIRGERTIPVEESDVDLNCADGCESGSIQLPAWDLEGNFDSELVVSQRIVERDLSQDPELIGETFRGDEVAAAPAAPAPKRGNAQGSRRLPILTASEAAGLDAEVVEQVAATFRTMLGDSTVTSSSRVKVAEPVLTAVRAEDHFRWNPEKTYTVTADGKVAEVSSFPETASLPRVSRPSRVEGEGWVVLTPDEEHAARLTSDGTAPQQSSVPPVWPSQLWASRGGGGGPQMSSARQEWSMVPHRAQTPASRSTGEFSLDAAWEATSLSFLRSPGESAAMLSPSARTVAAEASADALSQGPRPQIGTGSLRGRVLTPKGVAPETVTLQLAGTDLRLNADRDGFFEFSALPLGARAELLAWDSEMQLVRRLVTATVSSEDREIPVAMQNVAVIDATAQAFGESQSNVKAGFCAQIHALSPLLLSGGSVRVSDGSGVLAPRFFSDLGLPARDAHQLSESGRFCVFNVVNELVDVSVGLLGGMRRTFSVHLKPSVFESDVHFDMSESVYRNVSTSELIDFDAMIASSARESVHLFSAPGNRSWYDGSVSPAWGRVSSSFIRSEKDYASVLVESDQSSAPLYIPVGQELVEIGWGSAPNQSEGFAFVSRDMLLQGTSELPSDGQHRIMLAKSELPLKMLGQVAAEEFSRITGAEIDQGSGTAFVSLDAAALGLDYRDVRLSVRDSWTGMRTGKVHFVAPTPGSSHPRYVRAFVSGLPAGQYTLLVTDASGALKWLDIVRPRTNQLQVIAVENP